jgi:hypothetical protein
MITKEAVLLALGIMSGRLSRADLSKDDLKTLGFSEEQAKWNNKISVLEKAEEIIYTALIQ